MSPLKFWYFWEEEEEEAYKEENVAADETHSICISLLLTLGYTLSLSRSCSLGSPCFDDVTDKSASGRWRITEDRNEVVLSFFFVWQNVFLSLLIHIPMPFSYFMDWFFF